MRELSDYEKQLTEYVEQLIYDGVDEPDYDVIFDREYAYTTLGPDCAHDMPVGTVTRYFYCHGKLRKLIIPHVTFWGGLSTFDEGFPYMQEVYIFNEEGRLMRKFEWPRYRYGTAIPVRRTYSYRETESELCVVRCQESFSAKPDASSLPIVPKHAFTEEISLDDDDFRRFETHPLSCWLEWMVQKEAESPAAGSRFHLIKGSEDIAKIFKAHQAACEEAQAEEDQNEDSIDSEYLPDGVIYDELEDGSIRLECINEYCTTSNLLIPSQWKGAPVSEIGYPSWDELVYEFMLYTENDPLRRVFIQPGIRSIGAGAFWEEKNIYHIYVPDSVETFGDDAFSFLSIVYVHEGSCAHQYCLENDIRFELVSAEMSSDAFFNMKLTHDIGEALNDDQTLILPFALEGNSDLTSVEIPGSVTEIGMAAFHGCSALTSIVIPKGVTKIGEYAFFGCSSLESVEIPDSVTEIGERAFECCSSLKSIVIPEGVTQIQKRTFLSCSALASVVILQGVTRIGLNAFYGCSSLESVVIPDSVTEIHPGAFSSCSGLKSIAIPDSVTEISEFTFRNCGSLEFVAIPQSVTKICVQAFSGCSSLKSAMIPNNVVSIGKNAFEGVEHIIYNGPAQSDNNWGAKSRTTGTESAPEAEAIHVSPNDPAQPNGASAAASAWVDRMQCEQPGRLLERLLWWKKRRNC
ncbi:MAG: leucine-rich repeat domain-containing protein [Clostridia bacterium]|nr:leucine-rich repeat domain-containing protein [Clostridia bacterium]